MSVAPLGPLSLRQVLEEEFIALHGNLPKEYVQTRERGAAGEACTPAEFEDRLRQQLHAAIHALAKQNGDGACPRSALCLSGGGIRSATFALGVLQELAQRRLLTKFHYLSTVSGGGYVGGWLSAWMHRHSDGPEGVCDALTEFAKRKGSREAIEPAELRHLREYSNYLTPRLGLFSGDSWAVAATYLRNLALNWIVLLPLLAGILLLPRTMAALMWLPLRFNLPLSHGRILIGAFSVLGLIAVVSAISMLPSISSPRRRTATATRPGNSNAAGGVDVGNPSAGMTHVLMLVVAPLLLTATCNAICWAAYRAGLEYLPRATELLKLVLYWPEDTGPSFIAGTVIYYSLAAVIVWALARWRRKPNPPKLLRLAPVMAGIGLLVGTMSWGLTKLPGFSDPARQNIRAYVVFAVPLILLTYLATVTLYVGFTSWDLHPDADEDREWWARLMGTILICVCAWIVLTAISLYGGMLCRYLRSGSWTTSLSVATTIISGALGLMGGASASSASARGAVSPSWGTRIMHAVPAFAAPVFLLAFFVALSWGIEAILPGSWNLFPQHPPRAEEIQLRLPQGSTAQNVGTPRTTPGYVSEMTVFEKPQTIWPYFVLPFGLFATMGILGLLINVNRFSLHAMYRSRLIRAFLGASRLRQPNPFTGFDPGDNLPMHHLRRKSFFSTADLNGDAVAIVTLWIDRTNSVTDHIWQKLMQRLPTVTARLMQHRDNPIGDANGAFTRQELEGLIVDTLNSFLDDPKLYTISPFAEYADDAGLFNRMDPEKRDATRTIAGDVEAARRKRDLDGCSRLLNRLILEYVHQTKDGRSLLAHGARPPVPMHVVNVALNLVRGENLAWQERKADSFIVSPLHSGFRKGYRRTVDYGGGISLGTAVTISGAAASPNMGYHSSPAVTFLMALFNVRLGWWLGNPAEISVSTSFERLRNWIWQFPLRWRNDAYRGVTYHLTSPRLSIRPLFDEAFGRTTDRNEYVYLSDGGHFENLGIYEMIRRRCNIIVVTDASCDSRYSFESLANAIRKVRIDLGIPIELTKMRFKRTSKKDKEPLYYCAVGEIHYDAVDNDADPGMLIYIKPALIGDESADILNYSRTSRAFPHESTTDQWFSEAQFESYRELGQWCIKRICAAGPKDPQDLRELVDAARRHCRTKIAEVHEPRAVPVELPKRRRIGPVDFTRPAIETAPQLPGAYRLLEGTEIVFIGSGRDLRARLSSHKEGKEGPLTQAANAFEYEITAEEAKLEAEWLAEFKAEFDGALPRYNR